MPWRPPLRRSLHLRWTPTDDVQVIDPRGAQESADARDSATAAVVQPVLGSDAAEHSSGTVVRVMAVDWVGVALGTLGSLAVGVALWVVLPRGVILTKSHPVFRSYGGDPLPDTWAIKNVSALTATLESVTIQHMGMLEPAPLPLDGLSTVSLVFDDEVLEIRRTDRQESWTGLPIPPGESLTAHVGVNHMLTVRYRREGWSGRFERRELVIYGCA